MTPVRAPLTITAYLRIPFRAEEAHLAPMWASHIVPAVQRSIDLDAGYCWMVDDTPVACGGITLLWPGCGEAWFHMGETLPQYRAIVRDVRAAMYEVSDRLCLRRLQAHAACDFPKAHTFLLFLGFQPEALLRQYGPRGEDMVQYVRLWRRAP